MGSFLSSLLGGYANTLIAKHKQERDRELEAKKAEIGVLQSAVNTGQLDAKSTQAAFQRMEEITQELTGKKKGGFSFSNLIGKFQDANNQKPGSAPGGTTAAAPAPTSASPAPKVSLGIPPARPGTAPAATPGAVNLGNPPQPFNFRSQTDIISQNDLAEARARTQAATEQQKAEIKSATQAYMQAFPKAKPADVFNNVIAPMYGIKPPLKTDIKEVEDKNSPTGWSWRITDLTTGQQVGQNMVGAPVPTTAKPKAPKLTTIGGAPYSITDPDTGTVYTKSSIQKAPPDYQKQWSDAQDTYQKGIATKAAQQARQNAAILDRMTSSDQKKLVYKQVQDYIPVQTLYTRMQKTLDTAEKQGYLTGPQSTLLLAGHMGVTMGQVKGMRTTIQWIKENAAARPWDQDVQVAIQKVQHGGIISMDQARQFLGQVKDAADTQRETIEQEAQAYGVKVSLPGEGAGTENEIINKLLRKYAGNH